MRFLVLLLPAFAEASKCLTIFFGSVISLSIVFFSMQQIYIYVFFPAKFILKKKPLVKTKGDNTFKLKKQHESK